MERIASFCVDHTTLMPGMYLSRRDGAEGEILTWDIRMKQPNKGSYLSPAAAHTLEHLFATYARNSKYSKGVVYVGPMGCLTGFYLVTTGLTPAEALELTRSAFAWMAEFEGEIPGASAVECGNYLMMDPIAARAPRLLPCCRCWRLWTLKSCIIDQHYIKIECPLRKRSGHFWWADMESAPMEYRGIHSKLSKNSCRGEFHIRLCNAKTATH